MQTQYNRTTNLSTRTEEERNTFSPRDILYRSTHDLNGLFVVMLQNFAVKADEPPLFGRNEAVRYHKNVGLESAHNLLPRLVTAIEKQPSLYDIGIKVEALLEIFQTFGKEVGSTDVLIPLTYGSRTQNIVILLQQIITLGEKIKPTVIITPTVASIEE